jgi:branched-chain amino acid transport system permease protein
VSAAVQFYVSTLLIYAGVNIMACWALNIQFGMAGIVNLAFIMFQAAGAYTAGVLTLGTMASHGNYEHYIAGMELPFPVPVLAAAIVGAALAALVGVIVLRRLRTDFQAIVLLVVSLIATDVATNEVNLFNGSAGLSLIPQPLINIADTTLTWQWLYVGYTFVACGLVYVLVHLLTVSPLGRALRAVRDNEASAAALGKNVFALRMIAMVVGGAIAAVSGAVLVQFIGIWAPGSWFYGETLVFLAALIVGGTGNNLGAAFGAVLVPVIFAEATRFIPYVGRPGFIDAVQWIVLGLLILGFLWFRPQGVFPERRRRFSQIGNPVRAWVLRRRDPKTAESTA